MKILDREFFEGDVLGVTRGLLGKYVVFGDLVGRIVEMEARCRTRKARLACQNFL